VEIKDLEVVMLSKRTIVGKFIHSSWTNLNIRCGKYKHLQTVNKCKTYNNINIEFTREEYKNFCILNKNKIESLKNPSLDRINKFENYKLNNIQIIELKDNIRKDKLKFNDDKSICHKCNCIKSIEEFSTDNRRINKKSTICKICDNLRKKTHTCS